MYIEVHNCTKLFNLINTNHFYVLFKYTAIKRLSCKSTKDNA